MLAVLESISPAITVIYSLTNAMLPISSYTAGSPVQVYKTSWGHVILFITVVSIVCSLTKVPLLFFFAGVGASLSDADSSSVVGRKMASWRPRPELVPRPCRRHCGQLTLWWWTTHFCRPLYWYQVQHRWKGGSGFPSGRPSCPLIVHSWTGWN